MLQEIFARIVCVTVIILSSIATVQAADIHDAVLAGNLDTVKALIADTADLINSRDDLGITPLLYAINAGNNDITEYLLEHGADINLSDSDGNSPLHVAASEGQTDIAALLLEKGATTLNDATDAMHGGFVGQWTPLHMACLHGHPEMVTLLLDNGADIEAVDGVQRTPLIISAEGGNIDVVKILIDRGANINAVAIRGYTPLLWAARNRFGDMVDLLIEKKATLSEQMMPPAFQLAVLNGLSRLYTYVLEHDFDVAAAVKDDPEFILAAVSGGSVPILQLLVENGLSLNTADSDGWTTLHYAVSSRQTGMLKYLIDNGVDINGRNLKGETAYNLAVANDYPEAAEYLKAAGADTSEPQFPRLTGRYMGQQPPGDEPEMFLPGIVSGHDRAHSSIAFSPDGAEAYWTEMIPPEGRVAVMKRINDVWTYPQKSIVERDPSFSPDGKRLYFIKTRPFEPGEEPGGDPDVKEEYWYMEKTSSGWGDPVSVGNSVNGIGVHWPCSVDKNYNLYFSEFSEKMYFSEYKDGVYRTPVRLNEQFNNETLIGRSPCISPDSDYLLFSTNEGIRISFKRIDGSWTDAVDVGDIINASHENGCPRISPDGKYMFFVSAGQGRPWGIYWVSTDFIDRMRMAQPEND